MLCQGGTKPGGDIRLLEHQCRLQITLTVESRRKQKVARKQRTGLLIDVEYRLVS
jgi:hypothetical protein